MLVLVGQPRYSACAVVMPPTVAVIESTPKIASVTHPAAPPPAKARHILVAAHRRHQQTKLRLPRASPPLQPQRHVAGDDDCSSRPATPTWHLRCRTTSRMSNSSGTVKTPTRSCGFPPPPCLLRTVGRTNASATQSSTISCRRAARHTRLSITRCARF